MNLVKAGIAEVNGPVFRKFLTGACHTVSVQKTPFMVWSLSRNKTALNTAHSRSLGKVGPVRGVLRFWGGGGSIRRSPRGVFGGRAGVAGCGPIR